MSNRRTLIVVGAGASREANLPTNHELKKRIASILDIQFEMFDRLTSGDRIVYEALVLSLKGTNTQDENIYSYIEEAAWRIRDAMPQAISIDNFVDAHQGEKKIEICAKLAIVRSILEAEKGSLLYIDPSNRKTKLNFQALEKTWFNRFFQLLTENCRKDDLEERMESVTLIVFNYDRCVEHYLFHSLQNYFGIKSDNAANLVRRMKIYHPYGKVGSLPWQHNNDSVGFGAEPTKNLLLALSRGIKTFTEGTDPESSEIMAIRQQILESKIVIFLGFAFHRLNLDLLKSTNPPSRRRVLQKYFATAINISDSDCELIKGELTELSGINLGRIFLRNDLECNKLFHEYWRNLSFLK